MIVLISGVGAGDTGGWEQIGKNSWHWPVMGSSPDFIIVTFIPTPVDGNQPTPVASPHLQTDFFW